MSSRSYDQAQHPEMYNSIFVLKKKTAVIKSAQIKNGVKTLINQRIQMKE